MVSLETSSASSAGLNPEAWADTTARELLALQAQNRGLSAEQRADVVEKSLRERIGAVPEPERRRFLRSLAARFPLGEMNAAPQSAPEAAPLTADGWLAAFDSLKEQLNPDQQKALLEKVQEAGWMPPPSAPVATSGLAMPAAIEPLLPKEDLDPARVVQLIEVIFDAMRVLDGGFRRVWEGVADFGKTDPGLPRQSIEEIIKKFLSGDPDVPRVVLKNRIETTTKLIPAVLIAVKESWDAMEADVGNCLPEEIQKRVKKTTFGYETGCWKEYTKAAEELHPDTRVKEFFEQIVTKARAHIPR